MKKIRRKKEKEKNKNKKKWKNKRGKKQKKKEVTAQLPREEEKQAENCVSPSQHLLLTEAYISQEE